MTFIVNQEPGGALGPEQWAELAASIRREIKQQVDAQCRAYRIGFRDGAGVVAGDEEQVAFSDTVSAHMELKVPMSDIQWLRGGSPHE